MPCLTSLSATCRSCSPGMSPLSIYVSTSLTPLSSSSAVPTSPPDTVGYDTSSGSLPRICRSIEAISNFVADTSAFGFSSTVMRPPPKRLTDATFSTPRTELTMASMRDVTFCSTTLAGVFFQL